MGRLLHAFYAIQKNIFNLIIGGFVVRRTGRRIRSRGWVGGWVDRHRLVHHALYGGVKKEAAFLCCLGGGLHQKSISLAHTQHITNDQPGLCERNPRRRWIENATLCHHQLRIFDRQPKWHHSIALLYLVCILSGCTKIEAHCSHIFRSPD